MTQPPPVYVDSDSEPSVELSPTLVRELRVLLGIARPRDPTVLLLWPKYRKRRRSKVSVVAKFALVALPMLAALASSIGHG
jgi:hypothetical protein